MKIKLVQLDDKNSDLIKIIANNLNKKFKNKFFFGGIKKIPEKSYDKFKDQYNSKIIMDFLLNERGNSEKIIGITSKDIFYNDLNFVFGLADKDASLISTSRLDPSFYGETKNFDLLLKRTSKEVINELGYMFGLKECKNPSCVMSKSKSISYIDDKKDDFCKDCSLNISMEGIAI